MATGEAAAATEASDVADSDDAALLASIEHAELLRGGGAWRRDVAAGNHGAEDAMATGDAAAKAVAAGPVLCTCTVTEAGLGPHWEGESRQVQRRPALAMG